MNFKITYLSKLAAKTPAQSIFSDHLGDLGPEITEYPWSPSLFNGTRSIKNFESSSVLAYDIDNYPNQKQLRLDDAIELFCDYKVILGTTKSHQVPKGKHPAADRYRIIFTLDKPITDAVLYTAHWNYYKEKLGLNGIADEAAKDAARYFFPCKQLIFNSIEEQDKADLFMIEDLDFKKKAGRPRKDSLIKGKLNSKTLSFIARVSDGRGWHESFIAAAIDLKTQGYSHVEAAEELAKASPVGALDQTDIDQLEDVYINDRGEPGEKRSPWPDVKYKEDKNGDLITIIEKNSAKNARYLIQNVMKLKLRLNTRMNLIEKAEGEYINDMDLSDVNIAANDHKLGCGKELLNDVINKIGRENGYDPLKSSLEAVLWDGKSRFNELLGTLTFPEEVTQEDLKLYEIFLRKWLIGVVTRIYKPGSENNMLVFVGAQGAGKTRWFRRLAEIYPRGFIEAHINTDDKDSHLNLLKYFIWSVSELDTVTWSKDVGAIKDFITKSEVRARPAYGKHEVIGSAITSFCASVNSRDFLYDTTGNRRYLIMLVESVNANHIVDIGQVFAEAKVLMEQGERAWFNQTEIDIVNQYNERFISRSDILESFEARVSAGDRCYTLKEIADQLGLNELKNSDRRSIRDWMTKKRIKEVNHGNVKKYYVSVKPIHNTPRPKNIEGTVNRIDLLKGLIKEGSKEYDKGN